MMYENFVALRTNKIANFPKSFPNYRQQLKNFDVIFAAFLYRLRQ